MNWFEKHKPKKNLNHNIYKYLGVDESDGIQHSKMKEKIRKE